MRPTHLKNFFISSLVLSSLLMLVSASHAWWNDADNIDTLDPLTTDHVISRRHFIELRQKIDAVGAACGLGVTDWTDPLLRPGIDPIRAVHINELRGAIQAIYDYDPPGPEMSARPNNVLPYDDTVIVAGDPDPDANTLIRVSHINQLREAFDAVSCCGDGTCDESYGEDLTTCPSDCKCTYGDWENDLSDPAFCNLGSCGPDEIQQVRISSTYPAECPDIPRCIQNLDTCCEYGPAVPYIRPSDSLEYKTPNHCGYDGEGLKCSNSEILRQYIPNSVECPKKFECIGDENCCDYQWHTIDENEEIWAPDTSGGNQHLLCGTGPPGYCDQPWQRYQKRFVGEGKDPDICPETKPICNGDTEPCCKVQFTWNDIRAGLHEDDGIKLGCGAQGWNVYRRWQWLNGEAHSTCNEDVPHTCISVERPPHGWSSNYPTKCGPHQMMYMNPPRYPGWTKPDGSPGSLSGAHPYNNPARDPNIERIQPCQTLYICVSNHQDCCAMTDWETYGVGCDENACGPYNCEAGELCQKRVPTSGVAGCADEYRCLADAPECFECDFGVSPPDACVTEIDECAGIKECEDTNTWGLCVDSHLSCTTDPGVSGCDVCTPGEVDRDTCADNNIRFCDHCGDWGDCDCAFGETFDCTTDEGCIGESVCSFNVWQECAPTFGTCTPGSSKPCPEATALPEQIICDDCGDSWGECRCIDGLTLPCTTALGCNGHYHCGGDGEWTECLPDYPVCDGSDETSCPGYPTECCNICGTACVPC